MVAHLLVVLDITAAVLATALTLWLSRGGPEPMVIVRGVDPDGDVQLRQLGDSHRVTWQRRRWPRPRPDNWRAQRSTLSHDVGLVGFTAMVTLGLYQPRAVLVWLGARVVAGFVGWVLTPLRPGPPAPRRPRPIRRG